MILWYLLIGVASVIVAIIGVFLLYTLAVLAVASFKKLKEEVRKK
jgi:uncharacterized membrane protein YbaN (DUF454 family)